MSFKYNLCIPIPIKNCIKQTVHQVDYQET